MRRLTKDEEIACRSLKLDATKINQTKPKAVIVSEDLSATKTMPLFPWKHDPLGLRLQQMSGFELQEYLELFHRVPLEIDHKEWATQHAYQLCLSSSSLSWPLVLVGQRVQQIFDVVDENKVARQLKHYNLPNGASFPVTIFKVPYPSVGSFDRWTKEMRNYIYRAFHEAVGFTITN